MIGFYHSKAKKSVKFYLVGHGLMNTNPYAERRFQEARENLSSERNSENWEIEKFYHIVEHEALTLHAMMMMSEPAFILMKTGTFRSH